MNGHGPDNTAWMATVGCQLRDGQLLLQDRVVKKQTGLHIAAYQELQPGSAPQDLNELGLHLCLVLARGQHLAEAMKSTGKQKQSVLGTLKSWRQGWIQLKQQAHVWVRESGHRTSFLSLCSIHSLSLFDTDMICASG